MGAAQVLLDGQGDEEAPGFLCVGVAGGGVDVYVLGDGYLGW